MTVRRNERTIARAINGRAFFEVRLPRWYADALCAQTDPESFYPVKGKGGGTNIRLAKQVCKECPVLEKCLAYAVENDEAYGVWGGMTTRERRKIKEVA